jgi:hypothetical protein
MEKTSHHVSGWFVDRAEGESAISRLIANGIARDKLQIFDIRSAPAAPTFKEQSAGALKDLLVTGAIGTAVGAAVGVCAELVLVAANVSLFAASPIIAPAVMIGWGASLGGFIGAALSARHRTRNGIWSSEGEISESVGAVLAAGHVVLVAETRDPRESAIAREVLRNSVSAHGLRNAA